MGGQRCGSFCSCRLHQRCRLGEQPPMPGVAYRMCLLAASCTTALTSGPPHAAQSMRGAASKKAEALRALLSPGGVHSDLAAFACPCPLDPSVQLLGLVPSECSVFKSAMSPLRLTFRARLPGGSSMLGGAGGSGSLGDAGGGAASSGSGLQQSHELTGRMASLTLASQHSCASDGGGGGSRSSGRRNSLQQSSGGGVAGSLGAQPPAQQRPGDQSAAPGATEQRQQQQQQQQQQQPVGSPGGQQDALPASLPEPPAALVTLIYKRGDDLRQDQLVVQMISLMDRWAAPSRARAALASARCSSPACTRHTCTRRPLMGSACRGSVQARAPFQAACVPCRLCRRPACAACCARHPRPAGC